MEEGLLKPRLKGCMRRARGIRRDNFLVTGMTCIRASREQDVTSGLQRAVS